MRITAQAQRWPSSLAHALGLVPTTRRNSRLKFDLVLNPEANIASVTLSPRRSMDPRNM